jgi:hypothetical protein
MGNPDDLRGRNHFLIVDTLWALIILYAAARVLQVFPGRVPMLAVVALHVLPPALFALIHGAMFYRARHTLLHRSVPGSRKHLREFWRPCRISFWSLLLYGSHGAKAVLRPSLTGIGIRRNGVSVLDPGSFDCGKRPQPLKRDSGDSCAFGCSDHHGGLGSSDGPGLGYAITRLGLAERRILLWRPGQQFRGLVSDGLRDLSDIRALPATPDDQSTAIAIRLLENCSDVLCGFRRREHPSCDTTRRSNRGFDPAGVQWKVTQIIGACVFVSLFLWGPLQYGPGQGLHPARRKECQPES